MSHIFISYSRSDIKIVDKLNEDFKKKGFSTWLDRHNIPFGEDWHKEISKAIENCFAMVVVMSPKANESKYVHNEIHLADRYNKEIFPLLLAGEPFERLEGIQYVLLSKDRRFLPPLRFYKELASKYDREPQNVEDKKSKPLPYFGKQPSKLLPDEHLIDLRDWTDYARSGVNDYYGITMLALAFEEIKQHRRAMFYLRKSHQLEPRIKNKAWMNHHHGWTEEHHILLEKIIADSDFWLPNSS